MIFNYLYYTLRNSYINMGENTVPGFYAVGLISLLQYLPIYSTTILLNKLHLVNYVPDKTIVVTAVVSLLILNSLLFLPKGRHTKTSNKVESLDKRQLRNVRIGAIVFFMTSVLSVIILLLY
jgi:hypothetical protein